MESDLLIRQWAWSRYTEPDNNFADRSVLLYPRLERGAYRLQDSEYTCVFGGDWYRSRKCSRRQVKYLRRFLRRAGIAEASDLFLDSAYQESWALLVKYDDALFLQAVAWICHWLAQPIAAWRVRELHPNWDSLIERVARTLGMATIRQDPVAHTKPVAPSVLSITDPDAPEHWPSTNGDGTRTFPHAHPATSPMSENGSSILEYCGGETCHG
jgi:hypothetical protein